MATLEEFRTELLGWLDAPDAPKPPDSTAWSRRLGERGLLAPSWPSEMGGAGLEPETVKVLEEELRARGIRRAVDGGLTMLAPALREFASEEQLRRFLPPIARAEVTWAQGYSEPQAGSDLANIQTRADDQGDHYLVNGQKIWTSGAHEADWIFCLVRTDPDASKHAGISFLLVDLRSSGVTIAPIILISGRSPFCEVFFEDVQVPKENLVGGPGGGWPIAKRLLQFERSMLGSEGLAALTGSASRKSLPDLARDHVGTDAAGCLADPALRQELAQQLVVERANRLTGRRARGEDGARISSILKLVSSESNQRRYDLIMDLAGTDGLAWSRDRTSELPATRQWLRSRANTIEGGTSEIQLNVVAKRVLGMPAGGPAPEQSLAADEDQRQIRDAAQQFLRKVDPLAQVRTLRDDGDDPIGVAPNLWEAIRALGWPGLVAPEEHGGSELGHQSLGIVVEALGRHLALTPLFSSGVLAASALSITRGWSALPEAAGIATGEVRATLALDETARFDSGALRAWAEPVEGGYRLHGKKRAVLDGAGADIWLVIARMGSINAESFGLLRVPRASNDAAVTSHRWIDGRRAAELDLDGVIVPANALLGGPLSHDTLLEPLVDRAAAALSCELVGIAARAFTMTLEYLKDRKQFGQPLSAFQALQHRLARVFTEIELSISLTQKALRSIDENDAGASADASAAKAHASETARTATAEALQLHGGIGMTEEHDIGLFFKRARVSSTLFGDARFHHARFARLSGF